MAGMARMDIENSLLRCTGTNIEAREPSNAHATRRAANASQRNNRFRGSFTAFKLYPLELHRANVIFLPIRILHDQSNSG